MDDSNDMEQHMLINITDEIELELDDGSRWSIMPSNIDTACTWSPTATIGIREIGPDSPWPYELLNLGEGSSVKANRVA